MELARERFIRLGDLSALDLYIATWRPRSPRLEIISPPVEVAPISETPIFKDMVDEVVARRGSE